MLISDKMRTLPKRIGSYSMITERFHDIELNLSTIRDYFDNIEKGSVIEDLISYDNFSYRYSIRVCSRKEDLYLQFEFMEIFSDHIGPLSATTLKEVKYIGDIENVFEEFLEWLVSNEKERNKK